MQDHAALFYRCTRQGKQNTFHDIVVQKIQVIMVGHPAVYLGGCDRHPSLKPCGVYTVGINNTGMLYPCYPVPRACIPQQGNYKCGQPLHIKILATPQESAVPLISFSFSSWW